MHVAGMIIVKISLISFMRKDLKFRERKKRKKTKETKKENPDHLIMNDIRTGHHETTTALTII